MCAAIHSYCKSYNKEKVTAKSCYDPTRDIKEITMNPDLTVKFFIICFAELARGLMDII